MKKYIKYKEKYIVSDCGEVWKITNSGLKLKKQHKKGAGYLATSINNKYEYIHRIVMEAFKGYSELTVDHLDRNKENNNLSNLEYVTQTENSKRGNKKEVAWNGKIYNSAQELSLSLGLDKTACTSSIRAKSKLKGYYAKYI